MTKTILIDRLCGETCLALLEDGVLTELYFESKGREKLAGNIYLGRVENVLPGMNAAFVNIGLEKNAFLYAGDIQLDTRGDDALAEQLRGARIEKLVRPGQSIVVQVVKEPGGDKGPRVSCHITLPGRLAVLLPTVGYIGISRRITQDDTRARLHALAEGMTAPRGYGAIVRTAAQNADEASLRAEFDAIERLWESTMRRAKTAVFCTATTAWWSALCAICFPRKLKASAPTTRPFTRNWWKRPRRWRPGFPTASFLTARICRFSTAFAYPSRPNPPSSGAFGSKAGAIWYLTIPKRSRLSMSIPANSWANAPSRKRFSSLTARLRGRLRASFVCAILAASSSWTLSTWNRPGSARNFSKCCAPACAKTARIPIWRE